MAITLTRLKEIRDSLEVGEMLDFHVVDNGGTWGVYWRLSEVVDGDWYWMDGGKLRWRKTESAAQEAVERFQAEYGRCPT